MDDTIESRLRRLEDIRAIEEVLTSYCRGVDRLDKALMLSAYHPDAIDDHGLVVLSAEDFCDWAIGFHGAHNPVTQHAISNLSIELEGTTAHTECYYNFVGTVEGGRTRFSFGRYVDRLECRDGKWAIAARVCIIESTQELDAAGPSGLTTSNLSRAYAGTRTLKDVSYARPLEVFLPTS